MIWYVVSVYEDNKFLNALFNVVIVKIGGLYKNVKSMVN